jgi:hypothetical protein
MNTNQLVAVQITAKRATNPIHRFTQLAFNAVKALMS